MRAVVALLIVAGCGRINFDGRSAACDACLNANHTVHSQLDLDRQVPTMPVLDLPVLVVLDSTRFDFAAARSDLGDLELVMDGESLPYEIESLGPPAMVWVRVPRLTSALHLYYGSGEPPSFSGTVWSSFIGVYHLMSNKDATTRGNDGIVTGTHTVGKIANGLDLVPASVAHVEILHRDQVTTWSGEAITVSAWLNARSWPTSTFATLVARQGGTTVQDDFALGVMNGTLQAEIITSNGYKSVAIASITTNEWHHYRMVFDGSDLHVYVDDRGASIGHGGLLQQSANPLHIGADSNDAAPVAEAEFVDGVMDEVRIDSVARDPFWILLDHASQTDSLITYGPIERL